MKRSELEEAGKLHKDLESLGVRMTEIARATSFLVVAAGDPCAEKFYISGSVIRDALLLDISRRAAEIESKLIGLGVQT